MLGILYRILRMILKRNYSGTESQIANTIEIKL